MRHEQTSSEPATTSPRHPRPRNVLITGGSGGIGRAAVTRFARAGDHVWFTYHLGRERAEALVAELSADGRPPPVAFEFEQGDWASHERLMAALPGPVDVLVNNAAVGSKTVERYAADSHRQDEAFFQINSVGPLWLIRRLLPTMIDRGYGKIVNVSSVNGGMAMFPSFRVADGMSKAALTYLTRHVAAETAHVPVDVFAICPGAVDTEMLAASTLARLTPDRRRALEARLPMGRLLRPEEIANLVWWLCGDDARALHGAVIDASMGLGAHPGLLGGAEHETMTAAD
ncbi:MAG TPA: SDR family NAD(P)-dependent oxidoreductase [Streptosporangiaceae bacterium]|nr:SDR family NAD(P)-dependent oxidoreductase [Streptosporangiaceae bacterium]